MAKKNNNNQINSLRAREILDSRGYPTLEVCLGLNSGQKVKASVPVGSNHHSKVQDLRDGDHRRYSGCGVLLAANHINELIAPRLKDMSVLDQEQVDRLLIELDGTPDKRQLGANTMMAVSIAVARAAALSESRELFSYLIDSFNLDSSSNLPVPIFNLFNGGPHADTNLDFKEFLLIPNAKSKIFNTSGIEENMQKMVRAGAETFHALGKILISSGYDSDTGLEGGYAPDMDSSIQALELMMAAIIQAGYKPIEDFTLGLDIGSDLLYNQESKQYIFALDNLYFSSSNLVSLYEEWLQKFPITYLEDGLSAEDWPAWREATALLGDKLVLAGDDLFLSNLERIRRGIAEQAANAVVIKPNQIGTLTETIECAKLAKRQNYQLIISHRSGETNDDFIVDLAVALGAQFLKAGSLSRGERVAKYNRLTEISAFLNNLKS